MLNGKANECSQWSLRLRVRPGEITANKGRVVQYSQIDSIGVSGDKKGLHWYQWYDWYQ